MGYKIGDTVTIKSNLRYGYFYGALLVEEMLEYAGTTTTVERLTLSGNLVLSDGGCWKWSPDMLEGFDGYYLGNHVILNGEETVIVNVKRLPEDIYLTLDGVWHDKSEFEPIPGFDYSKETTPEYKVGDVVQVNINPNIEAYGRTGDLTGKLLEYNGLTSRITNISRGYYGISYKIKGCPVRFHGLALTLVDERPQYNVGDLVIYINHKARVVDNSELSSDLLKIDVDGEVKLVDVITISPLHNVTVKLNRDVFGIGTAGDIIKGFSTFDGVVIDSPVKYILPQLYIGEYSLVEDD